MTVVLTHPKSLNSTSMPRFARMIGEGMKEAGHAVQYWTSPSIALRIPLPSRFLKKWLGYIDQFVIYPHLLRKRVALESPDTLFVVSDQALGIWIPYFAHRPHAIHCHDFLALRSALGEFPENPTGWTGKKYQSLIQKGFSKGRNFVSVSENTQSELHRFLNCKPDRSVVIYNGLNGDYKPIPKNQAQADLSNHLKPGDERGFLLHVGGDQWYKNRSGVLRFYRAWCETSSKPPLPLWMVGPGPTNDQRALINDLPRGGRIRFIQNLSETELRAVYNLATLFLFPSIAEGFGWPIAEAMACGTRVVTTDKKPMTEVGGKAAIYIPRRPYKDEGEWEATCARIVETAIEASTEDVAQRIAAGIEQTKKFIATETIAQYERFYSQILISDSSKSMTR